MIRQSQGFTLIEVIIAMVILAFLSMFTAQAIQQAIQTKRKVQGDIDKNSALRDALRIMERDINMAFNYRDTYIELYNQAQEERLKRAQNKKPTKPATPETPGTPAAPVQPVQPTNPEEYKKKAVKVPTQFVGDADAISFTSVSNVRMLEESPISSQAEIGYKLKSCRRRSNQQNSPNCLWRRVSNYIHDDITKEGTETVLLENVTDFKLRYLGPGKQEEWVQMWYSNERGDAVTKDKFPYAVEITLAVQEVGGKQKDKELRMTMVAAIRNPNNAKDPAKNADGTPVAAPTTPPAQ